MTDRKSLENSGRSSAIKRRTTRRGEVAGPFGTTFEAPRAFSRSPRRSSSRLFAAGLDQGEELASALGSLGIDGQLVDPARQLLELLGRGEGGDLLVLDDLGHQHAG